jgi:hypothetical protein
MPRSRSALTPAAPAAAALALGLSAWAADPVWVRVAGLDAWNIGRLEDELRACAAENDRLDREWEESAVRSAANWELIRAVADGRRPLGAAAADALRLNAGNPGFLATLDFAHPAPTREAQAALNLIARVATLPELYEPAKSLALTRLRAEYAAEYQTAQAGRRADPVPQ